MAAKRRINAVFVWECKDREISAFEQKNPQDGGPNCGFFFKRSDLLDAKQFQIFINGGDAADAEVLN